MHYELIAKNNQPQLLLLAETLIEIEFEVYVREKGTENRMYALFCKNVRPEQMPFLKFE